MQAFTIESIRKTRSWINGIETHLDSPTIESAPRIRFHLSLNGWVTASSEPITNVWLAWRGNKIADAKLFAREDVRQTYPDKCHAAGFEIEAVPLLLGHDEPLKIVLDVESGRSTSLFEIYLRYTDLEDAGAHQAAENRVTVVPILAMARSGTTYLSQLLYDNVRLLGHNEYPYEARFAEHFAREWFAAAQPWSYEPAGNRGRHDMDQNFLAIREILGAREQSDGHVRELAQQVERSRCYYRDRVIALYRVLAPRAVAPVLVEKIGLGMELDLLRGLFGAAKPIFLIRDPRDVLLSMRGFNEKRGLYEFFEAGAKNFGELLFQMAANQRLLVDQYERCADDGLLLHYEDLVRDPQAVLERVVDFVGIEAAALGSGGSSTAHQHHMTAASPQESMERWRSELTPTEIDAANWMFKPFLDRFGYSC